MYRYEDRGCLAYKRKKMKRNYVASNDTNKRGEKDTPTKLRVGVREQKKILHKSELSLRAICTKRASDTEKEAVIVSIGGTQYRYRIFEFQSEENGYTHGILKRARRENKGVRAK